MRRLMIVWFVVSASCGNISQMRGEITCSPISADRCICCNSDRSGCLIGQSASFFTESCRALRDGGFVVLDKAK